MDDETLDLIYVGGCGRSGSTLLLRVLGCVDGFAPLGEVRRLWKLDPETSLCGCGEPVESCSFWADLIRKHALTEEREMRDRQKKIERRSHVPSFLGLPLGGVGSDLLSDYRSTVMSVYRHARRRSGARVLVDSSKRVPYAYLLHSMKSIRMHLIHLVRDPRAVANSNLRRKRDPDRDDPDSTTNVTRPTRVARRWNRRNVFFEGLKYLVDRSVTVRYEEFVGRPRRTLSRIFSTLALDDPVRTPFDGPKEIVLEKEHILESNPMRFKTGTIKLRLDDKWRRNLQPSHRRRVTAMTWPLVVKYGYRVFPET